MPEINSLEVALYGERIGDITWLGQDRTIFSFTESYANNLQRPTLSLSFKDEFGNLITDFPARQTAIEPFFSNVLPEGPLRTYLARLSGVKSEREFQLLWALGGDLPGALTVAPSIEGLVPPDGEVEKPADKSRQNALRFSLAGVQLKFSALGNSGKGGGLTIPASGAGGDWIVKLPSQTYAGVPENEFAMMEIARRLGIDVPETRLIDLDDIEGLPEGIDGNIAGRAYAVRRFDRTPDGPVHIEDFAQVLGRYPDDKYKHATYRLIAKIIATECGDESTDEFIRRLVFSTLIGNADMHLKNWSLIYPDRRHPVIAPAYDLLSTVAYIPDGEAALRYARTKRMDGFTWDELTYLCGKAMIPTHGALRVAKETTANFLELWAAEKTHLGLPDAVIASVDKHLGTLPITRG